MGLALEMKQATMDSQMTRIEEEIKRRANEGLYTLDIWNMEPHIKEWLIEEGFSIRLEDEVRGGIEISIVSWKEVG